jgi:hypothetical protein
MTRYQALAHFHVRGPVEHRLKKKKSGTQVAHLAALEDLFLLVNPSRGD